MADQSNQLDDIRKGKVDASITTQAGLAMAYAGHDWDQQKNDILAKNTDGSAKFTDDQRLQKMEDIAHKSLRETPLSTKDAPAYDSQNPTILDAQINSYIKRSEDLDAKQGVAKGTNLEAYLDGIGAATKAAGVTDEDFKKLDGIDFNNKLSMLANADYLQKMQPVVKGLANDYRKVAGDHIDSSLKTNTFEQDLVATVKADDAKGDDKDKLFKNAKDEETKPQSMGMMQLILMFIGALLGIDVSGLMGGGKDAAASEHNVEDTAKKNGISFEEFNKHLDVIKDKAEELSTGKYKDQKGVEHDLTAERRNTNVKQIEEFAGVPQDRTLDETQAKELGNKVIADIDKIRQPNGKTAVGDLGKDIDTITKNGAEANQHAAAVSKEFTVASAVLGTVGGVIATGTIEGGKAILGGNIDWDKVSQWASANKGQNAPAVAAAQDGAHPEVGNLAAPQIAQSHSQGPGTGSAKG